MYTIAKENTKHFLYCSKNVLSEYCSGDRHCDGPHGNGVNRDCLSKKCTNAFTDRRELALAIGEYVLKLSGI